MKSLRNRHLDLQLLSILLLLIMLQISGCNQVGEADPEQAKLSTGLIDYAIGQQGSVQLEVIDSAGKQTVVAIPIAGGKLITDSATITGGVLLLDVMKLDSSNKTADQLPLVAALKKAGNPKTNFTLPIRINSVVPAPVNKLMTDSGKLANASHLFSTTFDLSDTSTVLQYGCNLIMQPKSINWQTDAIAPPVAFGLYDLQYKGRIKFRWNVTAHKINPSKESDGH